MGSEIGCRMIRWVAARRAHIFKKLVARQICVKTGYMPMKTMLPTFLSALLLCSCSQHHSQSIAPKLDLVAGKEFKTGDESYTVRIAKQEGNSVAGIQIIQTARDGRKTTITADTGTLKVIQIPVTWTVSAPNGRSTSGVKMQNCVQLTIYNAKGQGSTTKFIMEEMSFNLPSPP